MRTRTLTLRPTQDRLDAYLAADAVIDHQHPSIATLAARLGPAGADASVAYARSAYEFARDQVAHSSDVGRHSAAYVASAVLAKRNAICFGKSHLLVALLRAGGLPAGLCYQRLVNERADRFVLHGLVAVRIQGRWRRLDPRGNKPGVDAQFSLEAERLAWPAQHARGEVDYPAVHPAPPPGLLAALAAARPGPGGYEHLPSEPR